MDWEEWYTFMCHSLSNGVSKKKRKKTRKWRERNKKRKRRIEEGKGSNYLNVVAINTVILCWTQLHNKLLHLGYQLHWNFSAIIRLQSLHCGISERKKFVRGRERERERERVGERAKLSTWVVSETIDNCSESKKISILPEDDCDFDHFTVCSHEMTVTTAEEHLWSHPPEVEIYISVSHLDGVCVCVCVCVCLREREREGGGERSNMQIWSKESLVIFEESFTFVILLKSVKIWNPFDLRKNYFLQGFGFEQKFRRFYKILFFFIISKISIDILSVT